MTDLIAAVFFVRPRQATTIPDHLGRAVYAQVLRWIDAQNPALAADIHGSDGPKPLTCSTVVGARRNQDKRRCVDPDTTYWVRVTGLAEQVSAKIAGWVAQPPAEMILDDIPFAIEAATVDPETHTWAGQSSYRDLAGPYLFGMEKPGGRVTLSFSTPTAFRSQGMTMPVPLPQLVFGSLSQRWNSFSAVVLSPEVRAFCETQVGMSRFNLRSRAYPLKDGHVQLGSVGRVTYVAFNTDRYWRGVLQILASYAFYSSVGYQTTIGLGQARAVAEPARR